MHGLVTEFLEEKRRDQEAEAAAKRRWKPSAVTVAALGVLAAVAWLIPFPPPTEVPPIPTAVTEAGARSEVFIAAQRVRRYRAEHGAFPRPLSQAGVTAQWIALQPVDSTDFELTANVDGVHVRYRSDIPDSTFLRQTRELLSRGTP